MATILVVEDNKLIAELIEMVLVARGYRYVSTADGSQAMALARERKPDLILLDVMLPGKDGYTIQTELLEEEATRSIPILIMTSKGQVEEIFRTAVNVKGLLSKPFSVNELISKVEETLKSSG